MGMFSFKITWPTRPSQHVQTCDDHTTTLPKNDMMLIITRLCSELNWDWFDVYHADLIAERHSKIDVAAHWGTIADIHVLYCESEASGKDLGSVLQKGMVEPEEEELKRLRALTKSLLTFFFVVINEEANEFRRRLALNEMILVVKSGDNLDDWVRRKCLSRGLIYEAGAGSTKEKILDLMMMADHHSD